MKKFNVITINPKVKEHFRKLADCTVVMLTQAAVKLPETDENTARIASQMTAIDGLSLFLDAYNEGTVSAIVEALDEAEANAKEEK